MSAENLVMAYKKNEPEQVTGSKDIRVVYWSDNSSSSNNSSDKLDSNINKYIKKKYSKKRSKKQ